MTRTAKGLDLAPGGRRYGRRMNSAPTLVIGRLGIGARVVVGLALMVLAIVGLPPVGHLLDVRRILIGLVVMPAAVTAVQIVRLRLAAGRTLRETGGLATLVNCVMLMALLAVAATRDVTLVFLGASLLIAAVRRYGGCETLAISNWLLRRDDQIGCLIFSPLDRMEDRVEGGRVSSRLHVRKIAGNSR